MDNIRLKYPEIIRKPGDPSSDISDYPYIGGLHLPPDERERQREKELSKLKGQKRQAQ
jgi:hypothetical protein